MKVRTLFSTERIWWLLLKSNQFLIFSAFVMISFLFETCGFTSNPNFISFKWRLRRKNSPAKCVIRATEIHRMEIRLIITIPLISVTFVVLHWSNVFFFFHISFLKMSCIYTETIEASVPGFNLMSQCKYGTQFVFFKNLSNWVDKEKLCIKAVYHDLLSDII